MLPLPNSRYRSLAVCGLLGAALMQTTIAQEAGVDETPEAAGVETLPEVVVAAPKLGRDLLKLPLSATVATGEFIEENAVRTVKDAAIYSPNTFFTEFSARKLSNPRFRGLGGSPMNPGVTTYYDGVPQFNGNSANLELLDVEQVDIIRGPAGALFGRNTVGGLINVTSRRPSLDSFGGEFETTFGNYNLYDVRGRVSGPLIKDQLGFSFAGGHNERDGYTENTVTRRDLDNRSSYFGKGQLLWVPSDKLEVRFILSGESARDGDYALNDLAELRRNPRQSARDFEGYTERDVILPTLEVTYHAGAFDFTSTTGFVWWQTEDFTDLDYLAGAPAALAAALPPGTPVPPITTSFLTRKNKEEQRTWTQEFRFSNPEGKPVEINEFTTLSWQAGAFFFYQDYDQATIQNREHLFLDVGFGFFATVVPGNVTTTASSLTDKGLGTYLQSTLTLWDKLDITTGLRWDYEDKDADLRTRSTTTAFPSPVGPTATSVTAITDQELSRSFNSLTPQAAISYRMTPDVLGYFSFAGGYKAGGFNAGSPAGTEVYDEEYSWNYELGLKGRALDERLNFGLALFYTDWQDLQLNVPNGGPATFHIANAGSATSKGIELALNAETGECRFDCFDPVIDISPVCERIARAPELLEMAGQLYGEQAHLFKDKLIFKPPGAKGYDMHQDFISWEGFPESFLTVIVAIDPSDAGSGATEVFGGYHQQGCMSPRDGMYHTLKEEQVDLTRGVTLDLQPGDVAFFSGFTPHRSGPNLADRSRRLLYLSYSAARDGGDLREGHYSFFHNWLQERYAEYGKTQTYFR